MTVPTSSDAMGRLIRETFRAMVESVEHRFDDSDLALSQWLALKLIGSGKIVCIGDVCRELGLESGSSTRLVDQLENKGLLCRRRSEADRRVVGIEATPQGIATLKAMQPCIDAFWEEQLAEFTSAERELLFSMLMRLRDKMLAGNRREKLRQEDCA